MGRRRPPIIPCLNCWCFSRYFQECVPQPFAEACYLQSLIYVLGVTSTLGDKRITAALLRAEPQLIRLQNHAQKPTHSFLCCSFVHFH